MQYLPIAAVSSYSSNYLQARMMNMKKRIMSLALLLASVMGINAQEMESPVGKFSVIPHVGVGISKWSNCELSFNGEEMLKSKYQTGFSGGVDVEYRATKEVAVSLGVNYARLGFKFPSYQTENKNADNSTTLEGYDNIHVNLDYIQVPLKVRAYITRNLSLTLGVQAGFLCGDGKLKMDYTSATIRNEEVTAKETETQTRTWPTKKWDVSIPIGVSYEYMGVILTAQYNLGLTNVSDASKIKDKDGESYIKENCKNRGFAVTVGYRFTL